jgi:glycosyltransferase involved in cell wall biosynthesis
MKILLIGNYPADRQYSMQGFANALLNGFQAQGHDVRLLAPEVHLQRIGSPHAGIGKWLGYADKYLLFPPEMRRACRWADIVHICDQGNAIYLRFLKDFPHTITCHDLLAIRASLGELSGWTTGRSGQIYQNLILQSLKYAGNIVCDSEATYQDTLRLTGIEPSRMSQIYVSLLQPYYPMPEAESAISMKALKIGSDQFFFHVGGNQPYKNRLMVLRIFHAYRQKTGNTTYKLVLAGKKITPEMEEYITREGLADCVLERTDVTEEALRALYSRAACLIFPSLYEGFGLPVIEAQASGCPVFTSNRPPLTEVGGTGAVYFDPTDPDGAAQIIAENLPNRDRMIEAGFANIPRFAPEIMLTRYLDVYQRIASGFQAKTAP